MSLRFNKYNCARKWVRYWFLLSALKSYPLMAVIRQWWVGWQLCRRCFGAYNRSVGMDSKFCDSCYYAMSNRSDYSFIGGGKPPIWN